MKSKNFPKRIAIFHDFFGAIGGGEKLVLTLARALRADVITTDVNRDSVEKLGFPDVRIMSLGETMKMPPLKQIHASLMFASSDFSKEYDFFIFSGNWAHYAALRHRPNLWYCHTPVRAFYDLMDRFIAAQPTAVHRLLFILWAGAHSFFDRLAVSKVQRIATNSFNTLARIKKFYGREAVVIHPPVPVEKFKYLKNGDFWLSVNRLYPEKRVGLQFEVFRRCPKESLVVVGGYAKGDHAEKNLGFLKDKPPNVEMMGAVSEEELRRLYGECKAFITTAVDEDFGMTPVEAMAAGKPVVAVDEGGFRETVADGKTGYLVPADAGSLAKAVLKISKHPNKYRAACIAQAKKFAARHFVQAVKKHIILVCSSIVRAEK